MPAVIKGLDLEVLVVLVSKMLYGSVLGPAWSMVVYKAFSALVEYAEHACDV